MPSAEGRGVVGAVGLLMSFVVWLFFYSARAGQCEFVYLSQFDYYYEIFKPKF